MFGFRTGYQCVVVDTEREGPEFLDTCDILKRVSFQALLDGMPEACSALCGDLPFVLKVKGKTTNAQDMGKKDFGIQSW
jgi:hypothetical protein